MDKQKKPWQRPELIVLVRSKAEEAVLVVCKITGRSGPNTTKNTCLHQPGNSCNNLCSAQSPS